MRFYFLMIIAILLMACHKEAALTPSAPEALPVLPQGNHSYDDSIVAVYSKYKTYILYQFSQFDYAYNQVDKKRDSAFSANPAYISAALRFLHINLFNTLPDTLLKRTMPYKILLASYIGGANTRSVTGYASTYATLTFGWADSTLLKQTTPAQVKKLRSDLIRFYMERAFRAGTVQIPRDFTLAAPNSYASVASNALKNQWGIIEPTGILLNQATDFLAYIETISTRTRTDIENTYFKASVDTKGNYRLKYNIVVAYFKAEFGVDLQAIGNTF